MIECWLLLIISFVIHADERIKHEFKMAAEGIKRGEGIRRGEGIKRGFKD